MPRGIGAVLGLPVIRNSRLVRWALFSGQKGNFEHDRLAGCASSRLKAHASAMTAIDTLMPEIRTGNFAPWRAGGFAGNHLIHSSFIPAKSVSSKRMTVALTTRSREVDRKST